MALNFGKLERIDQFQRDTVTGFIRSTTNKHIPEEIIHICMLFYALVDQFDPKCIDSKMIKINEETQSVKIRGYGHPSAYLKNIVDSGHHKWKFRIVQRTSVMSIGIWRVQMNESPPLDTYFTYGHDKGYAYSLSTGMSTAICGAQSRTKYGVRGKDGDIVEMILDFDDLSLSFKVNGIDFGKSHDVTQGKYRAAVHLIGKGDEIQFIG